jgi:hypothetical protein
MLSYSIVVLVKLEHMISLFSVFEVMEPQMNYMEELYDLREYKFTWMLCCYFSCIAYIFLYILNIHILQFS